MSVTTDRNDDGSENHSPWTSHAAQPKQTVATTPDDAGTLRELVRVALPLAISSGSLSLMHVVDRMFLTWYSKEALAASLPSGMLNWTLMSLAIGTVGYVNTFVAQYQGARRHDRVAASVWQGVHFAWITGVILLVFIPLAQPVFTFANHEPEVQKLEVIYFQILIWGSAPALVATALSSFYSGRGNTMVILYVDLIGNVTNIFLDYIFIFGIEIGDSYVPEMGIAGAAWGTVIANVVKLVIYAALVFNGASNREYGMRGAWRFDRDLFRRLLQFGAPNGIMMFLECVCFTFFMLELGKAGTNALAASNLAFNLNSLVFIPLFGVGTAVSTLVGQRIGEGRPEIAVRSTRLAFAMASIYTGLFAIVYLFQPHVLLAPYQTAENAAEFASMQREVTVLLRFVALYSFFDATVIIFSCAVRGAGDTKFALAFIVFCGIFLMVVPTYVGFAVFGPSLMIAWSAISVYIIVLGIGFLIRFEQGKWKSMRVIEPEPTAVAESV